MMQRRIYDNWLKGFIDFASFGEAPIKMLYWTGVSTIAGALRRRVWIDQRYFQWIPNFYIILVAPPGVVSKSTTANIGMSMLREVEGVHFGPDVVTWQKLVQSLSENREAFQVPGTDTFIPMSAITIASSEFGTFLNMDNREMVDILVDLWDGRSTFEKMTKTSGSDKIENVFLNIIACTTPSWIASNFPEYMIGGGFMSRCVFVYAKEKRQLVPYPDDYIPPEFTEMRRALIADLERISMLVGEFHLSPDAREWGRQWYIKMWTKRPEHLKDDIYGGYVARRQTHMHKLAMVISAAKRDTLIIEQDDLVEAECFLLETERDIEIIFSRVGQNDTTRCAAEIVAIVNDHGTVTIDEIYKKLFRTTSYNDFQVALTSAVHSGYIAVSQRGDKLIAEKRHAMQK